MKFELCVRSFFAALGFLVVSIFLFFFPLAISPNYQLPFRIACSLLFIISIFRMKHSAKIKTSGIESLGRYYPTHVLLFCATPVLYCALLLITFFDPAVTSESLFISHMSIVSLAAASASSAAFVPVLQIFFLTFIVAIPGVIMIYLHLQTSLALQVVPAMIVAFILFVFGNSKNFYNSMIKRFETENALDLEKENLRQTFITLEETKVEVLKQKSRADYASKMASLGQMAGGIAHEINTPLAIIQSYAEFINDEVNSETLSKQRLQKCADKIQFTTERIAKIIRGLLSFSREGSKDPFETFCIHQNIEQTLSFCRERFRATGVDLAVENFNSVHVNGRPVQISQVVLNLLNNSYDAVKNQENPKIKIEMQDLDTHVQVAVEDNGSGIDSSIKENLFQPFVTTKSIGQGTGLGLSVSHGIIEDHGGVLKLDLDSPTTRFLIRLPKSSTYKSNIISDHLA